MRETHLFLAAEEIKTIKAFVPMALSTTPHLIIETNEDGDSIAFMGIDGAKLEMPFIGPQERGKGLGRRLLEHGIENYGVRQLTVNEQNPQAQGLYEHMGSQVYKRSELDEQGNPYPILFMRLAHDTANACKMPIEHQVRNFKTKDQISDHIN